MRGDGRTGRPTARRFSFGAKRDLENRALAGGSPVGRTPNENVSGLEKVGCPTKAI